MGAFKSLSRISKLLADRDGLPVGEALTLRSANMVMLVCGDDVGRSRTLQLAVLTAARIAVRCFPGAVRAVVPEQAQCAQLLIWPYLAQSFGEALREILGSGHIDDAVDIAPAHGVLFGNAQDIQGASRVTFDGWIACTGPCGSTPRMPERECCSLAGVLAAALAISEIFMGFAKVSLQAGRRRVALSLWRPDLPIDEPDALGVPVDTLPANAWLLGLGHLGNAYLWSLVTLPFRNPKEICFFLNDFDIVEDTNLETGVLFESADETILKTRVIDRWLKNLGFETRLLERKFDAHFRNQAGEPGLGFCGFDNNPARRHIATAEIPFVVESGLGGMASNFDTISLHTYPNARSPHALWPDLSPEELKKHDLRQEALARDNAAYGDLSDDECGRVGLAGKSIAVPFVGVVAGTLVVAEALRVLHGGPKFGQVKLRLATLEPAACTYLGDYQVDQLAPIKPTDASPHGYEA